MELLDKQIREELLARVERDPTALAFYPASAGSGGLVVFSVIAAFCLGFAIGAWWAS